jgi:hypothetical protein
MMQNILQRQPDCISKPPYAVYFLHHLVKQSRHTQETNGANQVLNIENYKRNAREKGLF